jgi:hypothetical protein
MESNLMQVLRQTKVQFRVAVVVANAATRYSGTQSLQTALSGSNLYFITITARGLGVQTYNSARTATYPTTNFTDVDNNWTTAAEFNNTIRITELLDAHWGAEKHTIIFQLNMDVIVMK